MQHALSLIENEILPNPTDALEAAAELVAGYWQGNYRDIQSQTTSHLERKAMVESMDFLMDRLNRALLARKGRE